MTKNFLASIAAAGLVITPIAAQAGTRAGEAGVSMEALARSAASVGVAEYQGDDDDDDGIPMWLLIILFAAAGGGIIAAIESGENNKSPGT